MKKQNYTSQKGITLIALIITIIVMLILVGVTINVALNGGLFQKAEYASEEMQIAAEKEELLSAVLGAVGNDGKIKFGEIQLPSGWSKVSEKTFKSSKDNVYEVDDYGKITYKGKYTGGGNTPVAFDWESVGLENIDTNTEYIANGEMSLNFSTDGKLTAFMQGVPALIIDATDSKYITNGKIDFTEGLELLIGQKGRIKAEMNGNKTDIDITMIFFGEDGTEIEQLVFTCEKVLLDNTDIYSNAEVLQALGQTGGTYKGTWTVIERDTNGNPTKLVSTSAVAFCELGEYDNLEKGISAYKNAKTTLDTLAREGTGISSARSIALQDIYDIIGEDNIDKETEYGTVWNYYYDVDEQKVYSKHKTEDGSWSDPYNTGYSIQTFVDDNGNTVVVDSEGDEVTLTNTFYRYELSEDEKKQIGALASNYYWLASPCVDCFEQGAYFYVHYMNEGYIYLDSSSILFDSSGSNANYIGNGVRAVVSVSGL